MSAEPLNLETAMPDNLRPARPTSQDFPKLPTFAFDSSPMLPRPPRLPKFDDGDAFDNRDSASHNRGMRLYTRTGDDGTTGLIGGARTPKDDLQIDAYGTVDELNAELGLVRSTAEPWLAALLEPVQNELFIVGSHLALAAGQSAAAWKLPAMPSEAIARLEADIDAAELELPRLHNFILPGGTEVASLLHVARTVCRRAERLVVTFSRDRQLDGAMIEYLNRLSDWLFAHARLANHRAGVTDVLWSHE